jgi:hypothetical protein
LDESLDQPVVVAMACDALINTGLAEIEITILARAAVEMFIWN